MSKFPKVELDAKNFADFLHPPMSESTDRGSSIEMNEFQQCVSTITKCPFDGWYGQCTMGNY